MAKLGYIMNYTKTIWYWVACLNIKMQFLGKKTILKAKESKKANIVYDFEKELFI